MYNLTSPFTDAFNAHRATPSHIFGPSLAWSGTLRVTSQYSFGMALLFRLWRTGSCRVDNPASAELFIVVILPRKRTKRSWQQECRRLRQVDVASALPHLSMATAHKHVLVFSREHAEDCGECRGWWSHPAGLLRRVIRLSYSSTVPVSARAHNYMGMYGEPYFSTEYTRSIYPNLLSVPFHGSVHWSSDPHTRELPWQPSGQRSILMLYLGGNNQATDNKTRKGDWLARKAIQEQCLQNPSICTYLAYTHKRLKLKRESVFCLEPSGDTPNRKSIADSVAMGCIPVFFNNITDGLFLSWLPPTWGPISRVAVPREPFLAGQLDLGRLLSSMPPPLLARMKAAVQDSAPRFQVALDEMNGDAVHWTLLRLRDFSLKLKTERGAPNGSNHDSPSHTGSKLLNLSFALCRENANMRKGPSRAVFMPSMEAPSRVQTRTHGTGAPPGSSISFSTAPQCGLRECPLDYSLSDVNNSANSRQRGAEELEQRHEEARAACVRRSNATTVDTSTGGFCLGLGAKYHPADAIVVNVMSRLLGGLPRPSVTDFGAGIGVYGDALRARVPGLRYYGYDGAGNVQEKTAGRVNFADLSIPLSLPRTEWVMSLEMGEHVPHRFEHMVVRNFHAHNCRGLLLSWARPGQRGHGHVNGHSHKYIRELFEQLGYQYNPELTEMLRYNRTSPKASAIINYRKAHRWLRLNLMVLDRLQPVIPCTP